MVTCQKIFMLFFAHYRANQMLGQLYKKVELDVDKIVHKSKYLQKLKLELSSNISTDYNSKVV